MVTNKIINTNKPIRSILPMPRVRINIRDLSDIEELDDLDELMEFAEPEDYDNEDRREISSIALERRREGRKRGKAISKHLRQLEKFRGR
jgi:hypothetical protein